MYMKNTGSIGLDRHKQVKCDLCDSLSISTYLPTDAGEVMKCKGCGLVFLCSTLGSDEFKDLYSKDYFLEREDYFFRDGLVDASGTESAHVKDFRDGLDWIESFKRPPGKLLDIGCAMGSFLSLAQERSWECYGEEISEYAASIARDRLGVEVFGGRFRDAPYPNDFFDVLTMWDIIEHLPDPLEVLQAARRVLKVSGILLVNTPNEESLIRKMSRILYRASGGMIKFPVNRLYHCYHLNYFTAATLSLLFEKAGLEVIAQRSKVMPITRGRSSPSVKVIRKTLSIAERFFHTEYELFLICQKSK